MGYDEVRMSSSYWETIQGGLVTNEQALKLGTLPSFWAFSSGLESIFQTGKISTHHNILSDIFRTYITENVFRIDFPVWNVLCSSPSVFNHGF